jgi:hypothetical protein
MFRTCGEKHSPAKCDVFKKLSPQQRLKEIDSRELCRLCYRHLQGRGEHASLLGVFQVTLFCSGLCRTGSL